MKVRNKEIEVSCYPKKVMEVFISFKMPRKKKKTLNFMAPFYRWGSTA